jgi:hypothetical protein
VVALSQLLFCLSSLRRLAGSKRLDILRGQRLSSDGPVAACDILDDNRRDSSHVFAFDRHHSVGQLRYHLLLLFRREYSLN